MDVMIVHMHVIPPIWHTHQSKDKKKVWLKLNMYFDKLMCMVTNTYLEISIDTMHEYVACPTALKTVMCILSNELDKGSISVYADAMEVRVFFQQDVTIERIDTITNDQAWH